MSKICLIGGDRRNLELAKLLMEDNKNIVKTFANENMKLEGLEEYSSLEEAVSESNIIVTGIPISKDKEYLTGEYTNLKINLKDFISKLKNIFLVSGMISNEFGDNLIKNNNYILDLLKDEGYALVNAKITVEGIIKYLIENTDISIFNSKILVIGYGRIGKILCNVLKNFTENIYCISNKDEEIELIKANAINSITYDDLDKKLEEFEIIVNTVPKLILDNKRLEMVNKKVFILDIASKPGGIDFDFAEKNNIKFLWKLGIPAEISPITCAQKIKNMMYENNITYLLQ